MHITSKSAAGLGLAVTKPISGAQDPYIACFDVNITNLLQVNSRFGAS